MTKPNPEDFEIFEVRGNGYLAYRVGVKFPTKEEAEQFKAQILEWKEFYQNYYYYIEDNNYQNNLKELKEKAEKWDNAHKNFHHYYKQLESKVKELESSIIAKDLEHESLIKQYWNIENKVKELEEESKYHQAQGTIIGKQNKKLKEKLQKVNEILQYVDIDPHIKLNKIENIIHQEITGDKK